MTVTTVEPINDYRSGREIFNPSDYTSEKTSRQAWRVTTDSDTDSPHDILGIAGTAVGGVTLPLIGTAHEDDANSKCIDRQCNPESHGQKHHWIYIADYSNKYDIDENPLDDPAKTEWSTETFQTPVWETIDGKSIVNSAGDPFDPPFEKDDSRWTSVTRKNVADKVPDWMFAYPDVVNSDAYTIDGLNVGAGLAKISAIHLSETQTRNDIDYRVVTVTIHYRTENQGTGSGSGSYGSGSGSDDIEPWHANILDAGMREIDDQGSSTCPGRKIILNHCDKLPVTEPVPLDGEGHALQEPTLDNAEWLQFQVYHEKAFSAIEAIFT